MAHLIDKDALVAEVKNLIERAEAERILYPKTILAAKNYLLIEDYKKLLAIIDTLEVKDIPSWKRATEDTLIGCLVWDEQRHFHLYSDRVAKGELYISIADILRLPGSPRKE